MASCQTNEFKFIAIGDWGDEVKDQLPVAYSMARWADVNQPEFIISTGDNFYPDGVRSVTDPKWTTNWVDVYNNASLVNLPWYISVGNHDYFLSPDGDPRKYMQLTPLNLLKSHTAFADVTDFAFSTPSSYGIRAVFELQV